MKFVVEIDVPEGATHYSGNLLDSPTFYKLTLTGVVGEHWWLWDGDEWILSGHYAPFFLKELEPHGQ